MASETQISLKAAREVLGVGPFFSAGELRRAFREAAKRAHPDRAGGGAERFRQVVEAYHRLQAAQAGPDRIIQPPAPRPPRAHRAAHRPAGRPARRLGRAPCWPTAAASA